MTCIVAVECSDGAIIGGDYCGSNGFTYSIVSQPKVFEHSNILFGFTSTFRFGQLIEHMLDNDVLYPPQTGSEVYRWLIKDFVPKLRKVIDDQKYNISDGCNAILVVNNQVWELQQDLSVLRYEVGLASVGSGAFHAQSSMLTQMMLKFPDSRPTMDEAETMLRLSFDVTSAFVSSVSHKAKFLRQKKL